jgi:antitoxin (DNA-binding transcriptional repressor) of toxin-antitoxin stability system
MKTVSARQANHEFSALLSRVERGEEILITKRNNPIAVTPYVSSAVDIQHAIDVMGQGLSWGRPMRRFRREEMHERGGSPSTSTSSFTRLVRYPTRRRCGRAISSPVQCEQDGPSYCSKALRSLLMWRSARREYQSGTSEGRSADDEDSTVSTGSSPVLRSDPALKMACGRLPVSGTDLMSQPPLSRLHGPPLSLVPLRP